MTEPNGTTASLVTLAALFIDCIDCFGNFKKTPRCSPHAERSLFKLDCEKARLLVWANTVGILSPERQRLYLQFADPELEGKVRHEIEQIISLLTDSLALQAEYGIRPTTREESQQYVAVLSVNSMNIFNVAKVRYFARTQNPGRPAPQLDRVNWAIRDVSRFSFMLPTLQDLVENIILLVPVSPEIINSMVEDDIMTITDVPTLRLTESACADTYAIWSQRASKAIRASEVGTLDRRNNEEMFKDMKDPQTVEPEFDEYNSYPAQMHTKWLLKTTVVFTDKCLDDQTNRHCESATIHRAFSSTEKNISFTCDTDVAWNLGRRILSRFQPFETPEAQAAAEALRFRKSDLEGDLPPPVRIGKIYIYCGPCAFAIQTALDVISSSSVSEYFDYAIRIDDRLPTSCRRSSDVSDVLGAIRGALDEHHLGAYQFVLTRITQIDCPKLDQRKYALDEGSLRRDPWKRIFQSIISEDGDDFETGLPCRAIIFIAEASSCWMSLESPPFWVESRKPRETEIFTFAYVRSKGQFEVRKMYQGSYTRSKIAIEKNRSQLRQVTSPVSMSDSIELAPTLLVPRKRPRSDSKLGPGDDKGIEQMPFAAEPSIFRTLDY